MSQISFSSTGLAKTVVRETENWLRSWFARYVTDVLLAEADRHKLHSGSRRDKYSAEQIDVFLARLAGRRESKR
jgi:hypothetical protein